MCLSTERIIGAPQSGPPRPPAAAFERTGQPTPPIAQAVDVRHVEAEAYKTHMIVQTQATRISMRTRQTLSWRCAYRRLQKCAVCRLRAMEEHKSTSAMKHEYKASCAGAQNIFVRSCVAARQWVAQIHHGAPSCPAWKSDRRTQYTTCQVRGADVVPELLRTSLETKAAHKHDSYHGLVVTADALQGGALRCSNCTERS